MSKEKPTNLAASVAARLRNIAKTRGEEYELVLIRYAVERFLYRLGQTDYADDFILKGAMLFQLWTGESHRSTRDVDLLGRGDHSVERLASVAHEACSVAVMDDSLEFDPAKVMAEKIKEGQQYEGVRVTCVARLQSARIPVQIDIGFGDAVTPGPVTVPYPTLLDFPAPTLASYPRETVVAEKFQAMVALGLSNTRLKDFYDLWVLSRDFTFDGETLARAFRATFERRKTLLPTEAPLALTSEFGTDPAKVKQWAAFVRKVAPKASDIGLNEVCDVLARFLMPVAVAAGRGGAFNAIWPTAGPWNE